MNDEQECDRLGMEEKAFLVEGRVRAEALLPRVCLTLTQGLALIVWYSCSVEHGGWGPRQGLFEMRRWEIALEI